jgi:hypothetical protein
VLFTFFRVDVGMARESPVYVRYSNEITHVFVKEIKKEYGLVCIGSGGGMPHDVEEISVDFIAYKKAAVEDARILEVNSTEKFLKIINSHEKIRPFLREFPFKAERAIVTIAFRKSDNSVYTDGSVVHVFQARNNIFYYSEDKTTGNRILLLKEPYETALKIVQELPKKEDPPVK